MDFFGDAIRKAQALVDSALGIDETVAQEAMGMPLSSPVAYRKCAGACV